MRFSIILLALVLAAGTTIAADLGPVNRTTKTNDHILQNMSFDRGGGNTIEEAVPIEGLPFYDTAATCDNTNNYDEECPFDSMSPEVVYSLAPADDILISVDLCESLYDTKTYLYDSSLNLVACNDDANCGITGYQSALEEVPLAGGMTYYLVVDGYGGDCGQYILNVTEFIPPEPCVLECDGMAEGEPPLTQGYIDEYNGGCNSPTADAWQILTGDENGELVFCGVTGWYDFFGTQYRDTDWLIVPADVTGLVEITVETERDLWFVQLASSGCVTPEILQEMTVLQCQAGTMTIETDPGELIYLVVLPTEWNDPLEWNYIVTFSGLESGIVAAEDSSFGSVKALYR